MSKINHRRGETRRSVRSESHCGLSKTWTWFKRHTHRKARARLAVALHRERMDIVRERDDLYEPYRVVDDWWAWD